MIWIDLLAFALLAAIWFGLASKMPHFLLPLYILASMHPVPWALDVTLFPDRGVGELIVQWPTTGDVLLTVTALAIPGVRAQLLRRRTLLAGLAVAAAAWGLAVWQSDVPIETITFLAFTLVRLVLLIALLAWASSRASSTAWITAIGLAIGLFAASATLHLLGGALGFDDTLEAVGLIKADGRLHFPRLGNNKIGLALLLLSAALVHRVARLSGRRRRWVTVAALVGGLATSAAADLRFATTAFVFLIVVYLVETYGRSLVRERRGRIVLALLVVGAAVAAFATRGAQIATPRALSVLSGDFSIQEDSSLRSRLDLWSSAIEIWLDNPVLGRLGAWEYEREVERLDLLSPLETHNEYVWWLASFGAVGVLLLAALLYPAILASVRSSWLSRAATLVALGAMALNSATFFAITAACLAAFVHMGVSARRADPTLDDEAAPTAEASPK